MTPTRTARALEDLNRYREVSASRWVATKRYHLQGRKVGLPVVRWAGRSFRVRPNIPTRSEHRQQLVGECSECGTHSADHPPTGKKIRQVQICEPRLGRRIRSVPDLYPNPRVLSQSPLPFVPIKLPLSFGNQQYSCDQLSRDASVAAPCVYVNGSASRIFSHGRC